MIGDSVYALAPYTAADAKCPKCKLAQVASEEGICAIRVRFCALECERTRHRTIDGAPPAMGTAVIEHLHRTCPVCGYEWLETTAEQ